MTVSTIKFSQFGSVGYPMSSSYQRVGYIKGSSNFQEPDVITWTTATRPASPFDGLLGYNTDLEQYEYWDATAMKWSQLSSTSTTFVWNNVTTLSMTMETNNGYVANNAGQVVLTLPATANFGEIIRVAGYGSGGWQIVFNTGQNAIVGKNIATTTSGSISSSNQYDQIELLCVSANTTFLTLSSFGNLLIS